jgi:signal transduction histidine kinase
VTQHNGRAGAGAVEAFGPAIDGTRLEQFLSLQHGLLFSTGSDEALPDLLVHGIGSFLRLTGAAVGVRQDGEYRILAVYGPPLPYREQYHDGAQPAYGVTVARAAADTQGPGEVSTLQAIVLPFRVKDLVGALHLVAPGDAPLTASDLALARALAVIAGVALDNARQCRRLAQIARVKSDALAAMAHDLRAPLNALLGYAGMLRDGAFGPLTDEQHGVVQTLERQAIELIDLLGATLDVARLESDQLPIRSEEFSLGDVVAGLRAGTFARAAEAGVLSAKIAPDLPRLQTDRVKVKEILQNLLDNALKHSAGRVEVEATAAPDSDSVRITVNDAGPGIDAALLPHLFEPFQPGTARTSGSGFGLYIVRRFTEALGGRVAAHSVPGEGTSVVVELPRALR